MSKTNISIYRQTLRKFRQVEYNLAMRIQQHPSVSHEKRIDYIMTLTNLQQIRQNKLRERQKHKWKISKRKSNSLGTITHNFYQDNVQKIGKLHSKWESNKKFMNRSWMQPSTITPQGKKYPHTNQQTSLMDTCSSYFIHRKMRSAGGTRQKIIGHTQKKEMRHQQQRSQNFVKIAYSMRIKQSPASSRENFRSHRINQSQSFIKNTIKYSKPSTKESKADNFENYSKKLRIRPWSGPKGEQFLTILT